MYWTRQLIPDSLELKEASSTLYFAGQYITMAANQCIEKKDDESHTNAIWNSEKNWLIGNAIDSPYGNIHIAIDYPLLALLICNDELKPIAEIELVGKTRLEAFNWLNNQMWKLGLEVKGFEMEVQYDLPEHALTEGAKFEMEVPKHFLELANYRSNGHYALSKVSEKFNDKSELRVWPHHFDEGILINIAYTNNLASAQISMGLAIPDQYYDQPYFYVNPWKLTGVNSESLPPLESKGIWRTEGWIGQVLLAETFSSVVLHEEQEKLVIEFLNEAIENCLAILK